MKRILILLITLCSVININANTNSNLYFRAYQYTQRYLTTSGYWTNFEPYKQVNINITFDLTNDVIWIFSKRTQKYSVYKSDNYYDNDGEYVLRFFAVDQDGDKCHLRLMVRQNGTSQIYVDFSNISWCYNVVKR